MVYNNDLNCIHLHLIKDKELAEEAVKEFIILGQRL